MKNAFRILILLLSIVSIFQAVANTTSTTSNIPAAAEGGREGGVGNGHEPGV